MSDTTQAGTGGAATQLPASIQSLLEAVRNEQHMTPEKAALMLEQCSITAADLEPWVRLDHPDADSYGRAMIHDEGSFELMVMSWRPGDMSAIHDHGYTMWGAVRLYGEAEHATFEEQDGILTTKERCIFDEGSVVGVTHELIHQMGNVGDIPCLSLHLYGSHDRSENVTADARIFDLDEGKVQVTTGGAFFLLPEDQVTDRPSSIQGDFPTWLRHNAELLRRLQRMQPLEGRSGLAVREARLLREFNTVDTWQALRQELRIRLPRLTAEEQQSYIESLGRELASATQLFAQLHEAGSFEPTEDVLAIIAEIAGLLEDDGYISSVAGD